VCAAKAEARADQHEAQGYECHTVAAP
jgi:hypothetical protein